MKIGCIPYSYHRRDGAEVYFERVDDSVIVVVDTFMHKGLDVVVYDPTLKDMVGAECSTESYLPKGAHISCKPTIVNLWKTGNSDVLTNIVVDRMVEATKPNTQLTFSRYGFIELQKKPKNYAIRHAPRITICSTGDEHDSEIEAIASICQVMVEGADLCHTKRDLKWCINPDPYTINCYHENIIDIINKLMKGMDFDENVESTVENVLYDCMRDMYVMAVPDGRLNKDKGWYD